MLKKKLFYRIVFLSFLSAIIIIASFYILSLKSDSIKNNIETSEKLHLKFLSISLKKELNDAFIDLNMMAEEEEIRNYLNYPTKSNLSEVVNQFASYCKMAKSYDQIRFIDKNGMETVRVNYRKGKTSIIDRANLQNKANRYYFKNTIKLSKRQVYISPMDLNVEYGKIEKPFKSMVRFCMPLFNDAGEKKGILVINYLGDKLLQKKGNEIYSDIIGSVMFLNLDGYFLNSEIYKNEEFGFMFKDKQKFTFERYYPEAWKVIGKSNEGHIFMNKGLFTYTTLSAINLKTKGNEAQFNMLKIPKWKLVSYVSQNKLDIQYSGYRNFVIGIDVFLFVIIFFGSLFYFRFDKQRKKWIKALAVSEEKFRTAFTTSPDSVAMTKLSDGVFVNVNDAFTKIFGYSSKEIIGKSSLESNLWVNPEDREKFVSVLNSKKQFNNFEAEFRKRNGEIITGLMSAKIINIDGIPYSLSITRDISKMKEIQIRLEQSEQWHREIFEGSHDAIFITDTNSHLIDVNTAAVELTGYSRDELIKMSIPDLHEETDLAAHNKFFRRILDGEKIISQAKILCKNGKKVDVEFRNKRIIVDDKIFMHTTAKDVTEQNYIENQLRQSEAKFRSIVTNTEEILFMINDAGIFTLSEGKGLSALGLVPGQVVGQSAYEIYREYPDIINGIKHALEGETNFGKIIIEDNYFDIWYSPNKNSDGKIMGMLGMTINRTAQHFAEEQLKKSEENLRITLNSIGDAVISIDTKGIVTRLNPVAEKLIGYKYEEACGKKLQDVFNIVNAKTAEKVGNPVQKVLKNGHVVGMANHTKLISKSGKEYQISDSGSPIKDDEGKIVGVVLIFRDVTEEYNMREAIRESEQRLRLQIERMPIALIVWDKNFKVKSWNPAAEKIFGYSAEEALGRHPYGMIVPQELQPKIDRIWRRLLDGDSTAHSINRNNTKDGSSIICRWTNTPLKNSDGSIIGVLAMVQDITAQNKAEEQLKTSEEKYHSIIEAMPEAIISVDSSKTIVAWNKAAVVMFGFEKDEAIGNNITLIMPEGFKEKHNAGFAAAAKNNKLSELAEGVFELEGKRKNGNVFPVEMTLCHWQIEDELYFSANIRDITLRKEHELEILKLSQVVEQGRVSILITDLKSNMEYVNPYFTEITGYTKKEAIGQNPRILSSGEQTKEFYKKMYDRISKGKVWNGEFHNKKKNGEFYWEEAIITPIKDINRNIINYCAIKVNITKRKEIELEIKEYREHLEELVKERTVKLQKSEETFRALAEDSKDTIMRFDSNCRHLYVNPVVTEQTGMKAENFIGKTHAELGFPDDLVKQWEKAIKKVFDKKETNRIVFMLPSGIWIDWVLVPEFDTDKNVIAVIGSGRDITKLKNLEIELNTALKKEQELNELKTQFISTVSHEFRTPLTSIFSSADLLDLFGDNWTVEKRKKQFEQIRGSINRLTGMLDAVLQISRMESGKVSVNFENVNLSSLINNILKETESLLTPKHKILQNFDLVKNRYYLDKENLRTILLNLLSNAIKYSPEGGNIELDIKDEKNNLLFSVKDEGTGIAEKDLKNIFSEFYRADKTAYIQGTGLGLSIVKGLVTKLNGEITVSSKLGKGTIFTVTIPIKANEN